jgi:peroxiredoxin Q/BCP
MKRIILAAALATCTLAVAAEPEVGKPAPGLGLEATSLDTVFPDAKGKARLELKDLKGKNVVLFFYPKALTKGCTIESCGFRDMKEKFKEVNTVLLGISTDTLKKQQEFTDANKLNFPLLADPEKKVTTAYGALGKTGNALRYTFIIDKEGKLRKVYKKVSPAAHPQEVFDFVKSELAK